MGAQNLARQPNEPRETSCSLVLRMGALHVHFVFFLLKSVDLAAGLAKYQSLAVLRIRLDDFSGQPSP